MITIESVPVPDTLTGPDAQRFLEFVDVLHEVQVATWGSPDLAFTAAELWGRARHAAATRQRYLAAYEARGDGRRILGAAWASLPMADNPHLLSFRLGVLPAARRRGAGSALLMELGRIAARHGRTALVTFTEHPVEPDPTDLDVLQAPTGHGLVPMADAGVRFALAHGFALEQSSRHSVLDVPAPPERLDELEASARVLAEPDYEMVTWHGPAPESLLGQLADLMVAMSVEVPSGGLEVDAEEYSAERIRADEQRLADSGRIRTGAAARHRPSGSLVGYTLLESVERAPIAFQQDTLVLPSHRGHRLGRWLKVANLRRATAERPELRRIHTWNAEENQHMVAINDELGFRPEGTWASWQRVEGRR